MRSIVFDQNSLFVGARFRLSRLFLKNTEFERWKTQFNDDIYIYIPKIVVKFVIYNLKLQFKVSFSDHKRKETLNAFSKYQSATYKYNSLNKCKNAQTLCIVPQKQKPFIPTFVWTFRLFSPTPIAQIASVFERKLSKLR